MPETILVRMALKKGSLFCFPSKCIKKNQEKLKKCVFQITMLTWYLHGIADGFSGVWPHLEETPLSAFFLLLIIALSSWRNDSRNMNKSVYFTDLLVSE